MRQELMAIIAANADYASCIDADGLEDWPSFFTENCLYRVTTAQNMRDGLEASIVFANSRGMLIDRVSALRQANIYERQTYRHILGMARVIGLEGADIRSETPFMIARIMRDGTTSLFATGLYRDVWRREPELKLAERVVICDSSRIDTLLALPL